MFHHELESGKLLLSPCPDSTKLVTTHAISFIAKGETRQKRRSCGRVEGWGFLAATGGVAGSVWGMSLLWWRGCGLAGHDFIWNEGFIDFTTQGQRFPNSATSSNLQFGELGLGNVWRLLDSCGLFGAESSKQNELQTRHLQGLVPCTSDSPGSQLAPQPGALVTMMQGRLCPGTTWAEMDFDPRTEGDGALVFHSFIPFNSDTKSHQNSHQASQQLSDYGDHASHLEIQYDFVWKCNIMTDIRTLDGFCWLRNFIYVYACTSNICITKWQDGGRETHFLNA